MALNCVGGDGFPEVRGVKYPDMFEFWFDAIMSLHECRGECLKNCSCTAYANQYVINGGHGCVVWFGDLVDARELSGADGLQNIYIRLPVPLLDLSNNLEKEAKKWPIKLILIGLASGVLVASFINGSILFWARQKRRGKDEDMDLPTIGMAALVEATHNFSSENMIGLGGFRPVYKGKLSTGQLIAVKRLSKTSEQGLEEFKNEVKLIAKLQHKNLVRLLGFCTAGKERMLIYEYLPNKSLDYVVYVAA